MSPDASRDPLKDTVITTRDVTVRCKVTQAAGGGLVNRSSVKITLDNNESGTPPVSAPVDTRPNDEYEAKFDLSALKNGPVRFSCQASDLATPAVSSSQTLEALLDLGPSIEIFEPQDKKAYALKTPVPIQFQVKSVPLSESGDSEAEVKSVELKVSGVKIPVSETAPGLYQTSVDFDDKALFDVPPPDPDVTITATDGRTPTAAARTVRRAIVVDGAPPSIVINAPVSKQLVHGRLEVRLTITDAAGVDPSRVRASIEGEAAAVIAGSQWKVTGSTYVGTIQTGDFNPDGVQFTLKVTAADVVNNEASVSQLIYVDNVPPLLSLDPPNIRDWKSVMAKLVCSEEFDPVGSDAVSDQGLVTTNQSLYRVLVEDRASRASGSNYDTYAGIAAGSVELFAQKNPTVPVLIDSSPNDDVHVCDDINFDALAEDDRPAKVQLSPLTPRGSSWFPKVVDPDFFDSPTHHAPTCTADPNGSPTPPNALCPGTPMTRAVPGRGLDKPPAVYALSPSNASTGPCEGLTWELMNIVLKSDEEKGWRCLAAKAKDSIGNVGVSEPIRVCFSKSGAPCDGPPPDCHVGCEIVNTQRYAPDELWAR